MELIHWNIHMYLNKKEHLIMLHFIQLVHIWVNQMVCFVFKLFLVDRKHFNHPVGIDILCDIKMYEDIYIFHYSRLECLL